MLEERGDEVAEEGLSVRGLAAQMAEFGSTSGHNVGGGEGGLVDMGFFSGRSVWISWLRGQAVGSDESNRKDRMELNPGWRINGISGVVGCFSLSLRGKDEAGDGDGGKIRFAA